MTITLEDALVKMFITAIICLFVYLTISMILRWIRQMAEDGLPMFTHGTLVWHRNKPEDPKHPLGFSPEETPVDKEQSDREKLDAILSDTASTVSALLRGEVDFDEIKD